MGNLARAEVISALAVFSLCIHFRWQWIIEFAEDDVTRMWHEFRRSFLARLRQTWAAFNGRKRLHREKLFRENCNNFNVKQSGTLGKFSHVLKTSADCHNYSVHRSTLRKLQSFQRLDRNFQCAIVSKEFRFIVEVLKCCNRFRVPRFFPGTSRTLATLPNRNPFSNWCFRFKIQFDGFILVLRSPAPGLFHCFRTIWKW